MCVICDDVHNVESAAFTVAWCTFVLCDGGPKMHAYTQAFKFIVMVNVCIADLITMF
jgi:low affinity Fe/Cu permease